MTTSAPFGIAGAEDLRQRRTPLIIIPTTRGGMNREAFTAITRLAPISNAAQTGVASSRPPSVYSAFPIRTGGNPTGTEQVATRWRQVTSLLRTSLGRSHGNWTSTTP